MARPPRRDVFRYARWLRLVVCAAAMSFIMIRATASPDRPLVFYGSWLMVLVGALAIAEVFIGRVELRDDELSVQGLFARRHYRREDIAAVKWEKGSPVALRLRNDTWARLPDTGHANTKVAGAIRAWLNETKSREERVDR